MKRFALILLASAAFGHDTPAPTPTPAPSTSAHAGAAASARSHASATGGSASSVSGDSSASNVLRIEDRLQAPTVFAPAVYASGSCAYGWSAGLSIPGGSVAGGKSKPDPDCNLREMIRILTPLNPELALKLACTDPAVAKIAGEEGCVKPQPVPPVVPASCPDLSSYVSKVDYDEAMKRMLKSCVGK